MKRKKIEVKGALMETTLKNIERTLGERNFIGFPRVFVDYMGSVDGAIFLSQLVYWSDRAVRPDGGVYKKYDAWKEEIGLSKYEVQQAVLVLKKKGILGTKLKKADNAPTLHYYLDKKKFSSSINEFLQFKKKGISNQEKVDVEKPDYYAMDSGGTSDSLTETTTETSSYSLSEVDTQRTVNPYAWFCNRQRKMVGLGVSSTPISIPEDFFPEYNLVFWSVTRFPYRSIARTTEKFVDFFKSNGRKSCDWQMKWKVWMEEEREVPDEQWTSENDADYINDKKRVREAYLAFEYFIRVHSGSSGVCVPTERFLEAFPQLTEQTVKEILSCCSTGSHSKDVEPRFPVMFEEVTDSAHSKQSWNLLPKLKVVRDGQLVEKD